MREKGLIQFGACQFLMRNNMVCSQMRWKPVLQLMHAQETDFKTVDCTIDNSLGLLLGASSHVRLGGGALSLHSLIVESGFLAGKGSLPLPPRGAPPQPNQQSSQARPYFHHKHATLDARTCIPPPTPYDTFSVCTGAHACIIARPHIHTHANYTHWV